MKSSILSSTKAIWLVTTAAGVLFSAAAWAADYPGYAKVENFDGITGGAITDLTGAAKYINNQPDSVTFVDSLFYSRTPGVDDYGSRLSGFITPTETAEYVFFIAADDSTSFYLSTDSSPANQKLIAADQGWQNSRTWTGPGGASSGAGTTEAVFRRGFNPGATVMAANNFEWVGPFENRSDQFLNSARANLAGAANRWPTTNASGNAVINLTANQSYYFELLFKEGSGGENAGVTWNKAGDPDPVNGDPEIPGSFLRVTHTNVLSFLTSPQSQTIVQSGSVTFTFIAVGIPGDSDFTQFTYQWLVNGQPIADGTGTNPTYSIPSVALSDSGKRYSVRVTTATGLTGTSAEATLTVTTDATGPTIARIISSDTFASAQVTYSEAVGNEAVNPANYKFTGGLTVSDANFAIVVVDPNNPDNPKNPVNPANRVAVVLITSQQSDGASYDLTVSNVKDLTGNALSPNTAKMFANTFKPGLLSYKRWEGGNNIATMTNDPVRFANPTVSGTRTLAETGDYVAGNYVDRVDGFFIPSVTTNYVFLMSADNDGYMYLSTDATPGNKYLIAADVGWQNTREWTGPGGDTAKRRGDLMGGGPFENRSDELLTSTRAMDGTGQLNGLLPADGVDPDAWPNVDASGNAAISLVAGQRYYFQLWHVEGDSGRAEVTFKYSREADPAIGAVSRIAGNLIGTLVDPSSLGPVITNQPVGVDFNQGDTLSLSVGVDSAQPPTYQWYRGQTAISGATNSTLTITNAGVGAAGSYYVAVSNPNGSVNSQSVLAFTALSPPQRRTFQQDSTGLVVIEAENYYDATRAPDGHVWFPQTARAGYSGTGYLQALPDSAVSQPNYPALLTSSPRLDFKVSFTKTGTNYVWLRGGDPLATGAGDSVHAGIDGDNPASARRVDGAPGFNIATGWNWVGNIQGDTRAFIVVTNAGEHTVNIWMREDGFNLDRVLVTSDAAYTPTNAGPPESASDVAGGPAISLSRNASGAPVITYTGTLESASAVNGPYIAVAGASGGTFTPNLQQAVQQFYRAKQ